MAARAELFISGAGGTVSFRVTGADGLTVAHLDLGTEPYDQAAGRIAEADQSVRDVLTEALRSIRVQAEHAEDRVTVFVRPDALLAPQDWEAGVATLFDHISPANRPALVRYGKGPTVEPVTWEPGSTISRLLIDSRLQRLTERLQARFGERAVVQAPTDLRAELPQAEVVVWDAQHLPEMLSDMRPTTAGAPVLGIAVGDNAGHEVLEAGRLATSPLLGVTRDQQVVDAITAITTGADAENLIPHALQSADRFVSSPAGLDHLSLYSLAHAASKAVVTQPERAGRSVDIAMSLADDDTAFLQRVGDALDPSTRYALRLRIGDPYGDDTLFDVPPPSIEGSLPPSEGRGWDLEVAFFSHDLELASDRVVPLHLPERGSKEPAPEVRFVVSVANGAERAAGRIVVLLDNSPMQTFRLRAGPGESQRSAEPWIRVHLEDARCAEIDDLDHLTPRALFIGTNSNGTGSTHTVMWKGASGEGNVHLTDQAAEHLAGGYYDALHTAFWDNGQPRYRSGAPVQQDEHFDQAIRSLAAIGQKLWVAIRGTDSTPADLESLRTDSDVVLHVTRYEPAHALPWVAVYDRLLPENKTVRDATRVCAEPGCTHEPDDKSVICIKGFWGYRFVMEERLASHEPEKPHTVKGSIELFSDTDGSTVKKLATSLSKLEARPVTVSTGGRRPLFDALWRVRPHAGLVILVGHFDDKSVDAPRSPDHQKLLDDAPDAPFLQLGDPEELTEDPDQAFLTADSVEIEKRARKAPLHEPGPVVLLLGCGTAQLRLDGIVNHVQSFLDAHASSVIGTNSPMTRDALCGFADSLTTHLVGGGSDLGTAVLDWRRDLLHTGNPLGFSFTAYGASDATFKAA